MIRRLALAVGAAALLAMPAAAAAAPGKGTGKPSKPPAVPHATVKIDVGHLHGGKATILDTVPVTGTVTPFVPGQRVEVTFYLDGHRLVGRKVAVRQGPDETGTFESSVVVKEGGRYAVSAHHAATATLGADSTMRKSWRVTYPKLKRGGCGPVVEVFKAHLAKMGYVSGGGRCFTARLGREVLAYRKVNDLDRTKKAGPGILKAVFEGKGGYHVSYPDAGEHAEVSLAKQVLVLVKGGRPFAIYPVSTGKPSTPTITGHYSFYRQEPGYNSEGMYYSFYWHNGYAVHGYAEVPDYAASHGCVRTFIADQPRIYEQLHYGESIFVF
ncbi:MAG TPA: L,D-transpeptidase [Solirubrobacterales bacterium]|nr:L,D-transpeptidase [Solirubrobacterales bacterium]